MARHSAALPPHCVRQQGPPVGSRSFHAAMRCAPSRRGVASALPAAVQHRGALWCTQVNVDDSRFAQIYSSADFALDPTVRRAATRCNAAACVMPRCNGAARRVSRAHSQRAVCMPRCRWRHAWLRRRARSAPRQLMRIADAPDWATDSVAFSKCSRGGTACARRTLSLRRRRASRSSRRRR